jgi:hypothetical protein
MNLEVITENNNTRDSVCNGFVFILLCYVNDMPELKMGKSGDPVTYHRRGYFSCNYFFCYLP